ncbi:SDR family NAD(P)-dependent oxidoreductase [Nocardioides massiliensis]|uniref:NAD(P)-dependent dehydrogenase (Short-subunit alcohol dehydrogenase family) n=1 Tax=Nocardioides massiliensis TaxID=1325935 RepID=A0ABT9NTA2_9ACTN|nr:SDR family NAD(P)-dependent oxidoreductase [Nocardioides massiliensis]MDP9823643.1 NAD(P)-dependent dehydrogenase (short-subunit alcohol dehydrogenase family) [Nocardioides massiliensis]
MNRLADKVAVITGSASGQGRAAALRFAREGANVIVADFDEEGGRLVAQEIVDDGGNASFRRVDVTSEGDVAELIQYTVDAHAQIDIMYNNAGLVRMAPIADLPTADWDFTVLFELTQVYYGCKYALREMKRRGSGVIVNTASTSGLVGIPTHGPHAATKAGVIGLTRSIAVDYGADGIRCNAIAPGFVPFTKQTAYLSNDSSFIDMMVAVQPLKRPGTPDDVASAALFLASDEASWITGQVLAVDGGHTAM